jgi:pimeloyl-ACP methyl ester carboxylesterase
MSEEGISLRIIGVNSGDEIAGLRRVELNTTRGTIPIILHSATSPSRAILCISGAIGGFDGPTKLYERLGREMPRAEISVARLNYRVPNQFGECVLDTLAGLNFLKRMQCERAAIIGHSFGGAVAINAGTLAPTVTTVVAISSQLAGAHVVGDLAPRPLLLLHGTADAVLPHACSEMIFERASEPKTLKLFPGADHRLSHSGDELFHTVRDWLLSHI